MQALQEVREAINDEENTIPIAVRGVEVERREQELFALVKQRLDQAATDARGADLAEDGTRLYFYVWGLWTDPGFRNLVKHSAKEKDAAALTHATAFLAGYLMALDEVAAIARRHGSHEAIQALPVLWDCLPVSEGAHGGVPAPGSEESYQPEWSRASLI